jgi:hypothetical protein
MGGHFEKLRWLFHLSICINVIKWNVSSTNGSAFWETHVDVSLFQIALPHFYFSSFLWYLAGVKRQNDKKKLLVFYTSTKVRSEALAKHLQNKHPSTLGTSDLGMCLFWKSSHITLHITSSEFTYQGVYPNTYSLKPYHIPNQHGYLYI